jgi:hypothetical protein
MQSANGLIHPFALAFFRSQAYVFRDGAPAQINKDSFIHECPRRLILLKALTIRSANQVLGG